jgi:hypothetical protein
VAYHGDAVRIPINVTNAQLVTPTVLLYNLSATAGPFPSYLPPSSLQVLHPPTLPFALLTLTLHGKARHEFGSSRWNLGGLHGRVLALWRMTAETAVHLLVWP